MENIKTNSAKHLIDICEPLFLFTNQLRSANYVVDPVNLGKNIGRLFDEMEKAAKGIGISGDDILKAKFAIVALIDEMILGSPGELKDIWMEKPLQLEYFGESTAGMEFFNKLDTIRKNGVVQSDLLEVYYLCLIFGFEGKYKMMGKEKLKMLIDEITQGIRMRYDQEKEISPSWRRKEEIMDIVKHGIPAWIILAASFVPVIVVYLIFAILLGSDTDNIAIELLRLTK